MECSCQHGRIYICSNCYQEAIYDYEFRSAFCNTCEMLHEEYFITVEGCPKCNPEESDRIVDIINKYKFNESLQSNFETLLR